MNNSTIPFFNALLRRPSDTARVVALLFALLSMVAVMGLSPDLLAGRSAASVGEAAQVGAPAETEFQRRTLCNRDNTTAAQPTFSGPRIVSDPTPGDLRVDPKRRCPSGRFVAAPPAETVRDIAYGTDSAQRIDLHLPAELGAPVIVYLHHGGWYSGDRADVPEMVLWFVERGYAVASVGYRLASEHPFPAPIHDAKQAIRELKALGAETGRIDGDALVLYGISAGDHLAAFTAATVGEFESTGLTDTQAAYDSSVAGIVVSVGPSDLVQLYHHPHGWALPMIGDHAGCEPCTVDQLTVPSQDRVRPRRRRLRLLGLRRARSLVDAELRRAAPSPRHGPTPPAANARGSAWSTARPMPSTRR